MPELQGHVACMTVHCQSYSSFNISSSDACSWIGMVSQYSLLCTGYLGVSDFHLVASTTLVALNTFAPYIIMAVSLPILCSYLSCGQQPSHRQYRQTTQLCAMLLPFPGTLRCLAATLCSSLHCRHLMIWAVFAPKFAFELSFCLVGQGMIAAVAWFCQW